MVIYQGVDYIVEDIDWVGYVIIVDVRVQVVVGAYYFYFEVVQFVQFNGDRRDIISDDRGVRNQDGIVFKFFLIFLVKDIEVGGVYFFFVFYYKFDVVR